MRSRLAKHFQRTRKELGLSLPQLARLLGYQNITKGCNKIQKFEQRGEVHVDLLRKLADLLGVNEATIETLVEHDHREFVAQWNEWANEPIQPYMVVRLMPAAYLHKDLPVDVTTVDEAETFAAETARHWSKKVCLVWTRRISIWIDESGNMTGRKEALPGEANVPTMRLRGDKRTFTLQDPSNGQPFLRLIGLSRRPGSVFGKHSSLNSTE